MRAAFSFEYATEKLGAKPWHARTRYSGTKKRQDVGLKARRYRKDEMALGQGAFERQGSKDSPLQTDLGRR
jgi:hypothetical protein